MSIKAKVATEHWIDTVFESEMCRVQQCVLVDPREAWQHERYLNARPADRQDLLGDLQFRSQVVAEIRLQLIHKFFWHPECSDAGRDGGDGHEVEQLRGLATVAATEGAADAAVANGDVPSMH